MGLEVLSNKNIQSEFYLRLEEKMQASWVSQLSMYFDDVTQEVVPYNWLGMAPVLRKWEGDRLAKGLNEQGMTIANDPYEATLEIPEKHIRRDATGQVEIRLDQLADRTITHWMGLMSTLIANGDSSTAYDGHNFFSGSYEEGDSGSQSNNLTSSDDSALDVGTPSEPTADEMAGAILAVIEHMYGIKDDGGELINEMAGEFLVMVPLNMWGAASQAINANRLDTGSGTRDNPVQSAGVDVSLAANPRLTDDDAFQVFRTDAPAAPLIRQQEDGTEPDLWVLGAESEHAKKNGSWLTGLETWRGVGYGFWQYAAQATLS